MFAEFLQGQKDFPENILLKRQRELQNALERGIAFRREAENLLDKARQDMERPIRQLLDRAIAATAEVRGYEVVVNRDANTLPYLKPALTEDATPFIVEMIGTLRNY